MAENAKTIIDGDDQYKFPVVSARKDFDLPLDYVDGELPAVATYHNVFSLTLELRFKVFVLLFLIIVVPATIVFLICYLRDRKKQRTYEQHVALLLLDTPDPSVPYSDRLSRPIPGTVSEIRKAADRESERSSKTRTVSFADEENRRAGSNPSFSRSKRPFEVFGVPEIGEDDVFVEDCEILPEKNEPPAPLYEAENTQTSSNGKHKRDSGEVSLKKHSHMKTRFNSCDF